MFTHKSDCKKKGVGELETLQSNRDIPWELVPSPMLTPSELAAQRRGKEASDALERIKASEQVAA